MGLRELTGTRSSAGCIVAGLVPFRVITTSQAPDWEPLAFPHLRACLLLVSYQLMY